MPNDDAAPIFAQPKHKLSCSYEGCRFATWNAEALASHLDAGHIECSCGRWISEQGYGTHRARDPLCRPV